MGLVLRLAAGYHLLFLALVLTVPGQLSSLGLNTSSQALAADFWRAEAIGFSLGLGVGLLLASLNPLRQWAMVSAATAACVVIVAVAVWAAMRQGAMALPWWHVLLGYAIWLVPFGLILREAWDDLDRKSVV